jgi:hypothetical protein
VINWFAVTCLLVSLYVALNVNASGEFPPYVIFVEGLLAG